MREYALLLRNARHTRSCPCNVCRTLGSDSPLSPVLRAAWPLSLLAAGSASSPFAVASGSLLPLLPTALRLLVDAELLLLWYGTRPGN